MLSKKSTVQFNGTEAQKQELLEMIAELKDETVGDAEIPGLMERLGIEVGGHP